MPDIKLGFQDRTELVFIPDPASTDGSGKTGLNAAALTVSYTRVETDNDVVVTDVTSSLSDLSALTDAHADWGLKEVSSTLAPGLYRLDIADAVFAAGAWSAVVYVMITSSAAAASPLRFSLVAHDALDGVRLGLTALPNAAADAAGGLPISDAGGLDMDDLKADVTAILADTGTDGVVLAADAITAAKIADDAISSEHLATGALTADAFAADAIVAATLATGAITADAFAADAIVAATLATGAITADAFAADAIVAGTLATDAISADALAADALAEINAQVVDALATDTYAEPGQGAPAATTTLAAKINYLYKFMRNKITTTADNINVYNDAGDTIDQKSTHSDDGSVYTRGEFGTGA